MASLSIPIKNFPPVIASSSTLCPMYCDILGATYIHFILYTLQPSSDRFSLRNLVAFARLGWYPKFNINSRRCASPLTFMRRQSRRGREYDPARGWSTTTDLLRPAKFPFALRVRIPFNPGPFNLRLLFTLSIVYFLSFVRLPTRLLVCFYFIRTYCRVYFLPRFEAWKQMWGDELKIEPK